MRSSTTPRPARPIYTYTCAACGRTLRSPQARWVDPSHGPRVVCRYEGMCGRPERRAELLGRGRA